MKTWMMAVMVALIGFACMGCVNIPNEDDDDVILRTLPGRGLSDPDDRDAI